MIILYTLRGVWFVCCLLGENKTTPPTSLELSANQDGSNSSFSAATPDNKGLGQTPIYGE